jgi:hypothetical protein
MTYHDTMDALTGMGVLFITLCTFSGFAYAGEKIIITCEGTVQLLPTDPGSKSHAFARG